MRRTIKCNTIHLCIAVFTFCLLVRFAEYFLIKTDQTAIGENVLHKAVGIIILALALKRANLSWSDIGFQRNGFVSGILKGLLLGSACFAVSYGVELAILTLQGNPAQGGCLRSRKPCERTRRKKGNRTFGSGFLQTSWHDKIIGNRYMG